VNVRLVVAPFARGVAGVGMGAGPRPLAVAAALEAEEIAPPEPNAPLIGGTVEVARRIARAVDRALRAGAFPLVLAGECNSSLGTVAGAGAEDLGVVWLDAHADFDTPEDNRSGFFDVMSLAILTGSGWRALRETIPGFRPVAEEHVVLGGVRDLEPYQRERLAGSALEVVPGRLDRGELGAALERLRARVPAVYLHVDLDALDAREGRANAYAAPGGPSAAGLLAAVDAVFDAVHVRAAALTAYDPAADDDGRAGAVAARVLDRIVERAAGRRAAAM
jgi:arginase